MIYFLICTNSTCDWKEEIKRKEDIKKEDLICPICESFMILEEREKIKKLYKQ